MSRIKYRSAEVIEQRRRFAKRMTLLIGISLILIITAIVFFLRMEKIQIREVNINGTNIISREEILDTANQSLSGNYFWVIPKSNTFLYSVNELNDILRQKFPGIHSLDVSRDGLNKISIKLEERKPQTLWCKNAVDLAVPECYFVDNSGIVFAEAPFFSGNVYFIYKGKLNQEEPLGAQILNQNDFSNLDAFVSQANSKLGISIVGVDLKELGDFDLVLNSGAKILLNQKNSFDDIYTNLDAVLKSEHISSSSLSTLDYVDMRFGNKVYFKQK